MIGYLSGQIESKNLRYMVLMAGGVGYRIHLPLTDMVKLGGPNEHISLHIHTHMRENSLELFGFLTQESLNLFENLIQISGVGPKLALALLSGMDTAALALAIANADHQALSKIPGIGLKTAQRLTLELKDKLRQSFSKPKEPFLQNTILEDLRSAIANLGYKSARVDNAIKSIEPLAQQGQPIELLIKAVLKQLAA